MVPGVSTKDFLDLSVGTGVESVVLLLLASWTSMGGNMTSSLVASASSRTLGPSDSGL